MAKNIMSPKKWMSNKICEPWSFFGRRGQKYFRCDAFKIKRFGEVDVGMCKKRGNGYYECLDRRFPTPDWSKEIERIQRHEEYRSMDYLND